MSLKGKDEKKPLIFKITFIIAELYPIFFTVIVCWKRFTDSFSNFFDILTSREWSRFKEFDPDYLVTAIAFLIIAAGILNLFDSKSKKKQDKEEQKKKFDEVIFKTLSLDVFLKARRYTERVYNEIIPLEEYYKDYKDGKYAEIDKIPQALNNVLSITVEMTKDYFELETDVGTNFMLFFKNDNDTNKILIPLLLSGDCLYKRDVPEEDLLGVLYLTPALSLPPEGKRSDLTLTIPIYKETSHVYNSAERKSEDQIKLPGAPSAYFEDNHFIVGTKSKRNYEKLNEETIQEALDYFTKTAKDTRSILSFRVLQTRGENDTYNECLGILNLDGSNANDFDVNEVFYDTFYTLIYPTLCLSGKYLDCYGKYLTKKLTSLEQNDING